MPDRPQALTLALLCLLPLLGCGEFARGVEAYERGRYDAALAAFSAVAEAEGDDAAPETHYNLALAALRAGETRRAAAALEQVAGRGDDAFARMRDFLRGNLAFAQCQLADAQAASEEAEPFAYDVAIAHARRAFAHWQAAAAAGEDWPAARRNAERALLALDELARKKERAGQGGADSASQPNVNVLPAPGSNDDPDAPPQTPDVGAGNGDDPKDPADGAAADTELTPQQVLELLDTLARKQREKVELRRARRAARSRAEVEQDW